MVVDHREKILQFIKTRGPVLPYQIAKEIQTDIIMASAHLAELTATHKIKISHIKVGGSPLYYLLGQEEQLQKYTTSLNDKEKKAYDLLNEVKVLKENDMEPVVRVAIKELKDFAYPLNVNYNGTSQVFWKWHMTPDLEAEQLIKKKLNIYDKKEEKIVPRTEIKESKSEIKEPKSELKEVQQTIKTKDEKPKKEKKPRQKLDDSFLENIQKFFEKNSINVLTTEIIKKNSEIDFIIELPSIMGTLKYYCKAKNKKKLNEGDLSNVFVKAQFKKLPAIMVSNGELSPKAQDMIGKELNVVFKRL